MNRQVEMHVAAVKREIEEGRMIPTESIGMKTVNLDTFELKHKGGITNIAELIELKECIDDTLSNISNSVRMFIDYDKESPAYWGNINKCEEYKTYNVSIDLENFMHEESEGEELFPGDFFLPDNYSLAKKVEDAFKKSGGSMKGECGEHFRECASWDFKSKAKAKKLVKFIDNTYVQPAIKERKELFNIKKVIFGETQIDFEYKK
jgi:hypothetical protein